jgi:hypothetical protein
MKGMKAVQPNKPKMAAGAADTEERPSKTN